MPLGRRRSQNGDGATDEYERQRDFQRKQQLTQQAFNSHGELDRGWMREILDTEDLEGELQHFTIKKVQDMLNKEWILSNLMEAEAHDRWWWLEVQKLKIFGEHPPKESAIQGPVRAFLMDDRGEALWALTPHERNRIDQIIKTLQNRVTRSREGFERQQINTQIARTETEQSKQDTNGQGRLAGLFG